MATTLMNGPNPLSPEQSAQFTQLVGTLTPVQQAWISGYLAAAAEGGVANAPLDTPVAAAPLTILYGSQTGNAARVARALASEAATRGLETALVDMADYKPNKLKSERHLVIVVSTHGEGEPPETAARLHAFLASKKAPDLSGAGIAVLGLGDQSYEHFCQTAVDFEERLAGLGAEVVSARLLLDVDYEDHTSSWIDDTLGLFAPRLETKGAADNVVALPVNSAAPAWSKNTPFEAEILTTQKITGRGSAKHVVHLELSLEGSGLEYAPGDALGVHFENDPAAVDGLLTRLGIDGAREVAVGTGHKPLRDALIEDFELTQSYPGFVEAFAAATNNADLAKRLNDRTALREYLASRQIFDLVEEFGGEIDADAFAACLRRAQPRLYSIASSLKEAEDEVHLTVSVEGWTRDADDNGRIGGCSGHLGLRVEEGAKLRVYVEPNTRFRLPDNMSTPVIMIGAGTGIAPFRAFLQEREASGGEGKNWLFFGNQTFTQDFLYQVEMQAYLKSGALTRLDLAFSRDQAEKVYVQDKVRAAGAELIQWLEDGAHLYLCGDATRMAKDVRTALVDVVTTHTGRSDAEAEAYLDDLRDAQRFALDVY